MPDTQNRGGSEFAKYDAMSTEELQQILREDASKPVGEESDTDVLFYVMEVLAKRRKEQNEGKSPEEALESFKHNYNTYITENEISFDSESTPVPRKRSSGRWKRGLVAAAAVLVVIIGSSVAASAFGFDFWEIVAKWTQETFHFGYAGEAEESNAPSANFANPCESLQEALDNYAITTALVPNWIPDGYIESDIKIIESPTQRLFCTNYACGESIVIIRIADCLESYPTQIEQSDSLLEVYTCNGIDYYIFENFDRLEAVWITDRFECYISGPLSVSEIKEMISSIEKG